MTSIGFGAMGLSAFYGSAASTSEADAIAVLKHAQGKGVTLLNTATFYGPLNVDGYGHNLRLIKSAIASGLDPSKMEIMVKVGMDTRAPVEATGTQWKVLSDREALRADVRYTLDTLGLDCLDIAVLCRVPLDAPIEGAISALSEMVAEGLIKKIGVSEASSANIRRAHAVHPLHCIEQEWSLWSRDIEQDIVPTCRELGIKIVAYSPLGRGFLTGTLRSRADPAFSERDFRLSMQPRFAEEKFEENLALVDAVKGICERKGCSEGQLALAWLLAQATDGLVVVPIPGTSKVAHLDANMAASDVVLDAQDLAEIAAVFPADIDAKVGQRYMHMNMCFNAQTPGAAEEKH